MADTDKREFAASRRVGAPRRDGFARPTETPKIAAMLRRMIWRSLVPRALEGDSAAMEAVLELAADMREAETEIARALHERGYSWTEIAQLSGTSRQNAWQRFGKPDE